MPTNLGPEPVRATDSEEPQTLRALSRSPHPYHHQSSELPHLSHRFLLRRGSAQPGPNLGDDSDNVTSTTSYPTQPKDSPTTSDSGSEADDEHFLKGLPAPKVKLHKGLRGLNEPLSGFTTPLPSPAIIDELGKRGADAIPSTDGTSDARRGSGDLRRHRTTQKVIVRRLTEVGIIIGLGFMVSTNSQAAPLLKIWGRDYQLLGLVYTGLLILYPLRVIAWTHRHLRPFNRIPLRIPSQFDPAPLLYPPAITSFVSLLVSLENPSTILPNIMLCLCSIPQKLIPKVDPYATYDVVSWGISCLPLIWASTPRYSSSFVLTFGPVSEETLVLLYPLHQTLCAVLHYLTTTSLLTTELQLLSIALINVLLLASSPQIQILKAILWGGGLALLVLCGDVIRRGIALARVPKWRFRRAPECSQKSLWENALCLCSFGRLRYELLKAPHGDKAEDTICTSDEDTGPFFSRLSRVKTSELAMALSSGAEEVPPQSPKSEDDTRMNASSITRRHTLPYLENITRRYTTHTPSGRKKRATSLSVRPYLKLTQEQATLRKWLYAGYVYVSVICIVLGGIRSYVQNYALDGKEPIGWALGYLFGDLPWFRFQVVSANLERWICLPPRSDEKQCHSGWVQHIRHDDFGEANTRLLLCGYWLAIIIVGLLIVFRVSNVYEVDTRRKVFHFMMVGMFLPATYVDPTFAALALSLALAIFLILDLLRASQLPPLSKPIASFLAPYVDGRDFCGPVVISHIFLLIGCAIPLWLALASLPRIGDGPLAGWEVPTREVSMVSGVICVGLGDAAASLIGRRYGHRKWLWGGGKSLEGSVAFAAAVFVGLMAATAWLRIGGWPVMGGHSSLLVAARNAIICGSVTSLTEAVLTGGNDNVIVPVVLWTCVKSIGI